MDLQPLYYLLSAYLILLFILKIFFALSGSSKKKEKPAKAKKADKRKTVKQNLISKKAALEEDKKLAAQQSNIVKFNPNLNFSEEESSIDKYLKESKKIARMEKERQAREELLKNADNPLKNINANNNWPFDDLDISEKANVYNIGSPQPRRDHPFLSGVNFDNKINDDYEKVSHLLDDIENGNTPPLPIAESFKSLTRDMQVYIITKLINNTFK